MKTVYDPHLHRTVKDVEPTGLGGFMSYDRLISTLRQTGELRPGETVRHLVFGDQGIEIFVE